MQHQGAAGLWTTTVTTRIGLPDQISETTSYIGNNLGAFSEKKNTSNFKLSELELKTININPFFLQNMTFT